MSVCRLMAGLVGLALAAVVVTVLVAVGGEVRAELAPAIAKDIAKDSAASATPSFSTGCLPAPWPHGASMAGDSRGAQRSRRARDITQAAIFYPRHGLGRRGSPPGPAAASFMAAARRWNRRSCQPFALASSIPGEPRVCPQA